MDITGDYPASMINPLRPRSRACRLRYSTGRRAGAPRIMEQLPGYDQWKLASPFDEVCPECGRCIDSCECCDFCGEPIGICRCDEVDTDLEDDE